MDSEDDESEELDEDEDQGAERAAACPAEDGRPPREGVPGPERTQQVGGDASAGLSDGDGDRSLGRVAGRVWDPFGFLVTWVGPRVTALNVQVACFRQRHARLPLHIDGVTVVCFVGLWWTGVRCRLLAAGLAVPWLLQARHAPGAPTPPGR